jgi:hypothetical protein
MDAQGYVTPREVRDALRTLYDEDPETNLQSSLLRIFSDDLKPVDSRGRWRPSTLLFLTLGILAVLCGIFLYFTFGGPR